jgi:hypothetical protein
VGDTWVAAGQSVEFVSLQPKQNASTAALGYTITLWDVTRKPTGGLTADKGEGGDAHIRLGSAAVKSCHHPLGRDPQTNRGHHRG